MDVRIVQGQSEVNEKSVIHFTDDVIFYSYQSTLSINAKPKKFPQYYLRPNKKIHYKSRKYIWPNGQ